MSNQYELGHLRSVGLSPYDIKVLSTLMETGGEFPFYFERVALERQAMHHAGMDSLALRGLIEVDELRSTVGRWILRLTDKGRAICAQLERMNTRPTVEVQMHGSSPEVIKP